MPDWLLVIIGIVSGLALVYGIVWACIRSEARPGKRKRLLAEPSSRWDEPSLPGGD